MTVSDSNKIPFFGEIEDTKASALQKFGESFFKIEGTQLGRAYTFENGKLSKDTSKAEGSHNFRSGLAKTGRNLLRVLGIVTLVPAAFALIGKLSHIKSIKTNSSNKVIKIANTTMGTVRPTQKLLPSVTQSINENRYHAATSYLNEVEKSGAENQQVLRHNRMEILESLGNRIIMKAKNGITNEELRPLLKLYIDLEKQLNLTTEQKEIHDIKRARDAQIETDKATIGDFLTNEAFTSAYQKVQEMSYAGYDVMKSLLQTIVTTMHQRIIEDKTPGSNAEIKEQLLYICNDNEPKNRYLWGITYNDALNESLRLIMDELDDAPQTANFTDTPRSQKTQDQQKPEEQALRDALRNGDNRKVEDILQKNSSNTDLQIVMLRGLYNRMITWAMDLTDANRPLKMIIEPFHQAWNAIPTEKQSEELMFKKTRIDELENRLQTYIANHPRPRTY